MAAPQGEASGSASNSTSKHHTKYSPDVKKLAVEQNEKPQAIIPDRTLIYKTAPSKLMSGTQITIPAIPIKADIYVPSDSSKDIKSPILLFIHGGGWIHSNRKDYGTIWFHRFLALNYVICSMDYRLLPESKFWEDQCEDIRDIEKWLKEKLENQLVQEGFNIRLDSSNIIVAGASAGAHLALLTPKLWVQKPRAILSLYGPTNFHNIPYLNKGKWRQDNWPVPDCTPSLLAQGTTYEKPPTEFPVPQTNADRRLPRHFMGQHIYRTESLARFLLRGLLCEKKIENATERELLRLPRESDGITEEEIDEISALNLCQTITYPPTYQMLGDNDWLFQISQITEFASELTRQGIPNRAVVIEGGEHGFDTRYVYGDAGDVNYIKPAVEWLHECLQ